MGRVGLRGPEPAGDGGEDARPNARELGHELVELAVPEDKQPARHHRRRGGGARPVVEERGLTEEAARAERPDDHPVALDPYGSADDDEELIGVLTLAHQDLTGRDVDLVSEPPDLLEPLLVADREERHLLDQL